MVRFAQVRSNAVCDIALCTLTPRKVKEERVREAKVVLGVLQEKIVCPTPAPIIAREEKLNDEEGEEKEEEEEEEGPADVGTHPYSPAAMCMLIAALARAIATSSARGKVVHASAGVCPQSGEILALAAST